VEIDAEAAMLVQAELKKLAKREAEVSGRSKHLTYEVSY